MNYRIKRPREIQVNNIDIIVKLRWDIRTLYRQRWSGSDCL